ncbi:hypothetical protein J6590_032060, partial [Homalodisca vitripennis]
GLENTMRNRRRWRRRSERVVVALELTLLMTSHKEIAAESFCLYGSSRAGELAIENVSRFMQM